MTTKKMILLAFIFTCSHINSQTIHRVTHLFGIQEVGGVNVEVAKIGSTSSFNSCGVGPYWVGGMNTDGHYSFIFSPAITELQLDFHLINGIYTSGIEEVQIFVNGLHYPVQQSGDSLSCSFIAEITPEGNISGSVPTRQYGWLDTRITGSIDSLRIYNRVISGAPYGSLFSLYINTEISAIFAPMPNGMPIAFNPCTDDLVVLSDEEIQRVQLISHQGAILKNSAGRKLNLGNIQPGIFVVRVSTAFGVRTVKFVKYKM